MEPIAVYIHVPFCPSKCGYCDFNSYAMSGEIMDRTVAAMREEIRRSPWRGRPAKTMFFGGGTPTFLSDSQLCSLLEEIIQVHPPINNCEITSEANPGTVDIPKFRAMRTAGFNRLSLGAQSFQSGDLMRLGRVHEANEIARAVGAAREAGFDNLNLDLMFALPGQSLFAWEQNLDQAIALHPDHLSLYCLTIEPNTRFYRLNLRGMLNLPDDERQVEMYDLACDKTEAAGYSQYEISNFSRPGRESQHNLCYWRCEEYLGYGPGAVGCVEESGTRIRRTILKHPERYCEAVETSADLWCDSETLTPEEIRLERVMLGIRLNEGLPLSEDLDKNGLGLMAHRKWISQAGDRVSLTRVGRHFTSDVAMAIS